MTAQEHLARRAAACELLAAHDLAMRSGSDQVNAFGVLLLTRIEGVLFGDTPLDTFSDHELNEVIRLIRTIPGGDESDGDKPAEPRASH